MWVATSIVSVCVAANELNPAQAEDMTHGKAGEMYEAAKDKASDMAGKAKDIVSARLYCVHVCACNND